MSVAMERPISWFFWWSPGGPSSININLVGTGTSVMSSNSVAFCRRMKAYRGVVRQSTSPTSMLEASAPAGIFLRKCWLYWTINRSIDLNQSINQWVYSGKQIKIYGKKPKSSAKHDHLARVAVSTLQWTHCILPCSQFAINNLCLCSKIVSFSNKGRTEKSIDRRPSSKRYAFANLDRTFLNALPVYILISETTYIIYTASRGLSFRSVGHNVKNLNKIANPTPEPLCHVQRPLSNQDK